MKSSRGFSWRLLALAGIGGILMGAVPCLWAQEAAPESFPGVKKALTADQYAASGLGKLSPEEQARLDDALKQYFSGASQRVAEQAASQAVDRAVKEKRVETPTLIESHLVGTFSGFNGRTIFVLENGQRWKPVDSNARATFPPTDRPQIYIVRDYFGYKMAILGGTVLRVRRVS